MLPLFSAAATASGGRSVVVHGWQTDGRDSNYAQVTWAVPVSDGDGSLDVTAAPPAAVSGTTGAVAFSWSGLEAGGRYLGAITHTGPDGLLGLTTLTVNP